MDVRPISPLESPPNYTVTLPGSKSFTNRALLIAALAEGRSVIERALLSDDTSRMAGALQALGFQIEANGETLTVDGRNGQIPASSACLDIGNAGTAARFLTAALALGHGRYVLDGSPRMRERPIQPLLDALERLGARARSLEGNGCPPVEIAGGALRGGRTWIDGAASSQFISALMLIGPCLTEGLTIDIRGTVPSRPFLDLTIASMRDFGAEARWEGPGRIVVPGGQGYRSRTYGVEPDATAASYFLAAAAITGGRVRIEGLGAGSAQGDLAFVDMLGLMGCRVRLGRGYVEVTGPARLKGVEVDMGAISDTFLTLAAVAPFASTAVTIKGVAHTRRQESDRVSAAVAGLRRLGARVDERGDGLTVYPSARALHGAEIETYDDHRVAMSFALVGLRVPGVSILNPGCVAKTFPDYFDRLEALRG